GWGVSGRPLGFTCERRMSGMPVLRHACQGGPYGGLRPIRPRSGCRQGSGDRSRIGSTFMDRLLAMQVFERVADEGGFAAAARALDISPPVVTRLIAELETHLGTRL